MIILLKFDLKHFPSLYYWCLDSRLSSDFWKYWEIYWFGCGGTFFDSDFCFSPFVTNLLFLVHFVQIAKTNGDAIYTPT